jgi:hypothetical protein
LKEIFNLRRKAAKDMSKKKYYTAVAKVTDGKKEWEVTIYSNYKTMTEATEGAFRFAENYENTFISVLNINIF